MALLTPDQIALIQGAWERDHRAAGTRRAWQRDQIAEGRREWERGYEQRRTYVRENRDDLIYQFKLNGISKAHEEAGDFAAVFQDFASASAYAFLSTKLPGVSALWGATKEKVAAWMTEQLASLGIGAAAASAAAAGLAAFVLFIDLMDTFGLHRWYRDGEMYAAGLSAYTFPEYVRDRLAEYEIVAPGSSPYQGIAGALNGELKGLHQFAAGGAGTAYDKSISGCSAWRLVGWVFTAGYVDTCHEVAQQAMRPYVSEWYRVLRDVVEGMLLEGAGVNPGSLRGAPLYHPAQTAAPLAAGGTP